MKKILFIMFVFTFSVFSESITEMYNYSANPYEKGRFLHSELRSTVSDGRISDVEELLGLGAFVESLYQIDFEDDFRKFTHSTVLGIAVLRNDFEMVKLLLKNNANPDETIETFFLPKFYNNDEYYEEFLINASKNEEIKKLLIEAGADINVPVRGTEGTFFTLELFSLNDSGDFSFFSQTDEDYIKFLVNHGGDINEDIGPDSSIFEFFILPKGSLDLIEFFVKKGVAINKNHLTLVSDAGRLDVAEYILKKLKK